MPLQRAGDLALATGNDIETDSLIWRGMQAVAVRQGLKSPKADANIAQAQEAVQYEELAGDWQAYPGAETQGSLF